MNAPHDALAELAADPLNADLSDPTIAYDAESGETWRYLGIAPTGGYLFRHLCHPRTGSRVDLRVCVGGCDVC